MTQPIAPGGIALVQCATEPIHIPGSIQPHGCLIAFDPATLVVQQVSANAKAFFGIEAQALLRHPLHDVLDPRVLDAVRAALAAGSHPGGLQLRLPAGQMEATLHQHAGAAIMEIEPCPSGQGLGPNFDFDGGIRRIAMQEDLQALARVTAEVVRGLSGFDRVVVYRFDEDDHGAIVSEARADELPPYLGLHFPESDIPRQARELYRRNWIRTIPSSRYEPAPLLPSLRPDTGQPLDLTFAMLRSVSPIHLEYMANMGVQASMSVSLLVGGRLWGLISCGHRLPRAMPYRLRTACETIGRMVSLQIGAIQTLDLQRRKSAGAGNMRSLVAALRHPDGHGLAGLPSQAPAWLAIAEAGGASVVSGEAVSRVGDCPDGATVLALSQWIAERAGPGGLFWTRQLPLDEPRWGGCTRVASGVLAMVLPTPLHSCVLWFRPELVHTVSWGGDPGKPLVLEDDGSPASPQPRLHPRRSFETWQQEVRGRSAPWGPAEIDAVTELRRSAIEIDLYRQVQREQAAVKARDDLVAVVAHDLRTPMSVVVMQAAVIHRLLEKSGKEEATQRLRASAQVVQRAGQRMATLLNDLLDLARIEAGRFEISTSSQAAGQIIEDAYELLQPICEARRQVLVAHPAPDLRIRADPERLFQVLSNLITNASKFSPEGSEIHVKAARAAGGMCDFSVRDSGSGIGPDELPRIFDRYWQERSNGAGVGLGLYISRGIVEAHGGHIDAQSRVGQGTTISFTVPLDDAPLRR
jgi:light-regulated signal transduction histidine kinase (bacteriophytochrome)